MWQMLYFQLWKCLYNFRLFGYLVAEILWNCFFTFLLFSLPPLKINIVILPIVWLCWMLIILQIKSVLQKENATMILLCKSLYLNGKMDTFSFNKKRRKFVKASMLHRQKSILPFQQIGFLLEKKLVKPR